MKETLTVESVLNAITEQSKWWQRQLTESEDAQRNFQEMRPTDELGLDAQYSAVMFAAKKGEAAKNKLEALRTLYRAVKKMSEEV
jgi:hypothetical protein